jgi:hypothetical protein
LREQAQRCAGDATEIDGALVYQSVGPGGSQVTVIDDLVAFYLAGPAILVTEKMIRATLQEARTLTTP